MGPSGCGAGAPETPAEEPGPPPADRESWDVVLEMGEPGLRVQVRAPYLQDRVDRQLSRADSGAQIAFCDLAWVPYCTVECRRLVLDAKEQRAILAGQVRARGPEGVELRTDSLVWDQRTGELWAPTVFELRARAGTETGQGLRTRSELASWSAEDVAGTWTVAGDRGEVAVGVTARRERGARREGRVALEYDSLEVSWDQVRLRAPRGSFDEAGSVVRLAGGVEAEEGDRAFRAQELECDLARRHTRARGAAEVRSPSLLVQGEQVEQDRAQRRWVALGQPAVWRRDERMVAARRLEYDEGSDLVSAGGEVVYRGEDRTLRAAALQYRRAQQRLEAGGGVSLQAPELEGSASGEELTLDLKEERAQLRGAPRWQRPRSLSEPLLVRAAELGLDLRQATVSGEGFGAAAGGLGLKAGRGTYRREAQRLELGAGVELRQEQDGATCVVSADTLVAVLQDGVVERTEWPAAVDGAIASAAGQRVWLHAGTGRARLASERLSQVELSDPAEVTQQDAGSDGANRFRGRRMVLDLAGDGGVKHVVVEGEAELWSHLPATAGAQRPAGNHVRGERLDIRFADGRLAEVRVEERIEGSYFPPPDESR